MLDLAILTDLSRSAPGKHKPIDLGETKATGGHNIIEEPAPKKAPTPK